MQTVLTKDLGDGVRLVSLNRPHRLNAIVPKMLDHLVEAIEAADRDSAIKAIVLTLVDQINILRQALPSPLPAIKPAEAIAAPVL